jgi:hypothetical protein
MNRFPSPPVALPGIEDDAAATHQLTNLLQTLPQQIEAAQRNYS